MITLKLGFLPLNRDFGAVTRTIQSLGNWWHFIDRSWLVDTHLNADEIMERLKPNLYASDRLLIVRVAPDFSGYLPEEAWTWIREHVHH